MTTLIKLPASNFASQGYARIANPEELQRINGRPIPLPEKVSKLGTRPRKLLYVRNHSVRSGAKSLRFEGISEEFSSWYFVSVPIPAEELTENAWL